MNNRCFSATALSIAVISCGGAPPIPPALAYGMPTVREVTYAYSDTTIVSLSLFGQSLELRQEGVAEYVVTHAHKRRVLSKLNLRECYHLFKLRTQPTAHFTLREVMGRALELASAEHPLLFSYLQLRG